MFKTKEEELRAETLSGHFVVGCNFLFLSQLSVMQGGWASLQKSHVLQFAKYCCTLTVYFGGKYVNVVKQTRR